MFLTSYIADLDGVLLLMSKIGCGYPRFCCVSELIRFLLFVQGVSREEIQRCLYYRHEEDETRSVVMMILGGLHKEKNLRELEKEISTL